MQMQNCKQYDKILLFLLFFSFFLPAKVPYSGYVLYLVVLFILFKLFIVDRACCNVFFLFFFLPVLLIPASYLVEAALWGNTVLGEVRSFIIRYLILCMLNAIVFTIYYKRSYLDNLLIAYMLLGFLLSTVVIQQFFNIFNLNSIYLSKLLPPTTENSIKLVADLIAGFGRPIGFVGNPNEVGFQLSICFIASAYYCLNIESNLLSMTSFWVCFFAIILTSSRGSIAILVAMLLVIFLTSKIGFFRKAFFFTSILALLSFFFIFLGEIQPFNNIFNRIAGLLAVGEDRSWQARGVLYWWFNLEWFANSPIVGVGTLKHIQPEAADNEWLLLLRQMGVAGVFTLLLTILHPLIRSLYFKSANKQYFSLSVALLVGGGLYMLPSAFISSPYLYYPWSILYFASVASGFDTEQNNSSPHVISKKTAPGASNRPSA